jgi:pyruvate kinase
MVARGDLGVELPFTEIPVIQKSLLIKALSMGSATMVATQMLESMVSAPRPTRAEASDVANAVLDGADAIMLSAETAIGRFPVEATAAAAQIADTADRKGILPWGDRRGRVPESEAQAVAHAAGALAKSGAVAAIACYTQSGLSARLLSAIRPNVPILALSPNPAVVRQLTLRKAVVPSECEQVGDTDSMIVMLDNEIRRSGFLEPGSLVAMVGSTPIGAARTNFMKVHRLGSH